MRQTMHLCISTATPHNDVRIEEETRGKYITLHVCMYSCHSLVRESVEGKKRKKKEQTHGPDHVTVRTHAVSPLMDSNVLEFIEILDQVREGSKIGNLGQGKRDQPFLTTHIHDAFLPSSYSADGDG